MPRVSVELLPDAPAAEVPAAGWVADDSAIDTVFCVDEIYHRDAWGILAAAARETSRVRLALGVAHVTALAERLGIPLASVHRALRSAAGSQLYDPRRKSVQRAALEALLVHAAPYELPPRRLGLTVGSGAPSSSAAFANAA